jgi:hypothetical protein
MVRFTPTIQERLLGVKMSETVQIVKIEIPRTVEKIWHRRQMMNVF